MQCDVCSVRWIVVGRVCTFHTIHHTLAPHACTPPPPIHLSSSPETTQDELTAPLLGQHDGASPSSDGAHARDDAALGGWLDEHDSWFGVGGYVGGAGEEVLEDDDETVLLPGAC